MPTDIFSNRIEWHQSVRLIKNCTYSGVDSCVGRETFLFMTASHFFFLVSSVENLNMIHWPNFWASRIISLTDCTQHTCEHHAHLFSLFNLTMVKQKQINGWSNVSHFKTEWDVSLHVVTSSMNGKALHSYRWCWLNTLAPALDSLN